MNKNIKYLVDRKFRWPYQYYPGAAEEFKNVCEQLGFSASIHPQKGSHGAEFYIFKHIDGNAEFATEEFIEFLKSNGRNIEGEFRNFYITLPNKEFPNFSEHKFYVSYKQKK